MKNLQSENFSSQRLNYRRFRTTDLEHLKELMQNENVMRYTGFRHVQSDEKIQECLNKWISNKESPLGVWCVENKDNHAFVGWIMLKYIDRDSPELGFMLSEHQWGYGYATEIGKAVLEHGFNTLNCKKIIASADINNSASKSVLIKIGMEKCDEEKKDGISIVYYQAIK